MEERCCLLLPQHLQARSKNLAHSKNQLKRLQGRSSSLEVDFDFNNFNFIFQFCELFYQYKMIMYNKANI